MSDSIPFPRKDIPRLRARGGFAMAMALGAIVVIGLLIAGAFFISTQQSRTGRSVLSQEDAFRIAEAGLAQTVTEWKADSAPTANGQSWLRTQVVVPNTPVNFRPDVKVTRLNSDLYQILSEASVGSAGGVRTESVRRVSQLVRVVGPTFNIRGALTVRGQTKIGGSSLVDGNDDNPAGWSCDAEGPAKPGIAIADPNQISRSGCNNWSCVDGDPKIATDPIAGQTSTYFTFGDFAWADLVSMANIVVTTNNFAPAPAFINGRCDDSRQTNWGDVNRLLPKGVCESYFPIIYYPGNAKLTGGTGQGILLVEGDLEVQGQFRFYGPVIVRGRLKTAGTGGHFNGAVMAANVDLEENSVLGNAVVNYSSCAVATAVRQAGRARPVVQRSWAELY
jgi:hypothetical protein